LRKSVIEEYYKIKEKGFCYVEYGFYPADL
jgi:hypothetical protein